MSDDRLTTLKNQMAELGSKSVRPTVTIAYATCYFPALAKAAGFRNGEIFELAESWNILPPDSARAWVKIETELELEFKRAKDRDPKLDSPFSEWLGHLADELKNADDPAYLLVHKIACDVEDVEDGKPASCRLHRQADEAEEPLDYRTADQFRAMAEQAEDDEDLADIHGSAIIWRTDKPRRDDSDEVDDEIPW